MDNGSNSVHQVSKIYKRNENNFYLSLTFYIVKESCMYALKGECAPPTTLQLPVHARLSHQQINRNHKVENFWQNK